MLEAADIIERYGRILASSEQMLAAAEQSHWDELVALETARRELLAAVTAEPTPSLNESQRAQKRELIMRTLNTDERVRALTQPWMDELQVILTSVQAQRKLNKAYDAR